MQYYYHQNGQQYGPFTLDELKQRSINKDTLVWKAGMEEWVSAGELSDLSGLFPPIVPVPPALPNNTYIPYYAPATPKRSRNGIKAGPVIGLVAFVFLVAFLVWKQNQKNPYAEPEGEEVALIDPNGLADREVVFQPEIESKKNTKNTTSVDLERIRQAKNWEDFIKVSRSSYTTGAFGGVDNLYVTLENYSVLNIESARAMIYILKANGKLYSVIESKFDNIPPGGSATYGPIKTERGVEVGAPFIVQIISNDDMIHYPLGSSKDYFDEPPSEVN